MSLVDTLGAVLPAEALAGAAGTDESMGFGAGPAGRVPVVRPGSADEVAAVMSWATREGVGVLPMRSGSRLPAGVGGGPGPDGPGSDGGPGGAGSVGGGGRERIVLRTDRLTGVEIYEAADLTITAGAGTLLGTIDETLGAHRQWLPFDPPGVMVRSLAGLVATGDSGPLRTGYGDLRNHVLGMTVVTGDGRIVRLGGRVVKNVAGFDVLRPMVGSHGSLAIMTSVCVRAFPVPAVDRLLTLDADESGALADVAIGVATAPVTPASSVLSWRSGEAARLAVRLHGAEPTVDADQRTIEEHLGRPFAVVADADATPQEDVAPTVLELSTRVSRLRELLEIIDGLEPSWLIADAYGVRLRVGLGALDADAIGVARGRVEEIGGALRVRRAPTGAALQGLSSSSSADEAALVDSLRSVYDPGGALWPTHTS